MRSIADVQRTWNGADQYTFSVQLKRRCGLDVARLVANYHRGCPHEDHERYGSVFCDCGWFATGKEKANLPDGWG